MKLSIVIPCLNESKTILRAVEEAHRFGRKYPKIGVEIIVADNGSTDGSPQIVQKLKRVRLITVPIPGYGAVLHWGILKAKGAYVCFADADLSYDLKELGKFANLIPQKPDLVLGSRFKGTIANDAMPLLNRYMGTPVLTFFIRLFYKIPTTDCNSGMRMVRKAFYKKLNMRNSGMEWASELLIKTALNNGKYLEVPIRFRKDKRGRSPHLLRWSDGWRHLKAIVLLKPNTLLIPILALFLLTGIMYSQISLSFFLFLMTITLTLSYIAVKVLHFALDGTGGRTAKIILKSPIAPTAIIITTFWIALLILNHPRNETFRFMGSSIIMIFTMWVFLIETIKTHLINRLPEYV